MDTRYTASLAAVLLALGSASCAKESLAGLRPETAPEATGSNAVSFRTLTDQYRGLRGKKEDAFPNGVADLNGDHTEFKAVAYKADGTNFFPTSDIKLTPSYLSGSRWGTETAYEWPADGSKIEVFAYAKKQDYNYRYYIEEYGSDGSSYNSIITTFDNAAKANNNIALQFSNAQISESNMDVVVAHAIGDPDKHKASGIPLKFEHIMSEVNVQVALSAGEPGYPAAGLSATEYLEFVLSGSKYEPVPKTIYAPYYVNVAAVKLMNIQYTGTFTFNDAYLTDPENEPVMKFTPTDRTERYVIPYDLRDTTEGSPVLQLTNEYQDVLGEGKHRFYIPPQKVTPWTGYKQRTEGKTEAEAPMKTGFYIGLLINFYTDTDNVAEAGNMDYYLYPTLGSIATQRFIKTTPSGIGKDITDGAYAWIAIPVPNFTEFESGKSYTFKINLLGNPAARGLGYVDPNQNVPTPYDDLTIWWGDHTYDLQAPKYQNVFLEKGVSDVITHSYFFNNSSYNYNGTEKTIEAIYEVSTGLNTNPVLPRLTAAQGFPLIIGSGQTSSGLNSIVTIDETDTDSPIIEQAL